MACYALSRFDLAGKENIFFWTITNRMAPAAVFLLPFFLLYTKVFVIGDFKLYDTRIGLILLYCTFNLPFAIWTLRPTIDGIPKELDEAATVDGCSTWQVIREVVWPLARPGLAVTFILTWVFAWNEFLLAATLTSFNARTITTGLSEYVTTTGTEWGKMAAISIITLIPALIIFSMVQRQHRRRPHLRRGQGVAPWPIRSTPRPRPRRRRRGGAGRRRRAGPPRLPADPDQLVRPALHRHLHRASRSSCSGCASSSQSDPALDLPHPRRSPSASSIIRKG